MGAFSEHWEIPQWIVDSSPPWWAGCICPGIGRWSCSPPPPHPPSGWGWTSRSPCCRPWAGGRTRSSWWRDPAGSQAGSSSWSGSDTAQTRTRWQTKPKQYNYQENQQKNNRIKVTIIHLVSKDRVELVKDVFWESCSLDGDGSSAFSDLGRRHLGDNGTGSAYPWTEPT